MPLQLLIVELHGPDAQVRGIGQRDETLSEYPCDIGARIGSQHAQLLAARDIQFDETGGWRSPAGADRQFFAVFGKADDDVASVDLAQKRRLLEGRAEQVAPGGLL